MDHGANPGLVSHFTKRALLEIARAMIDRSVPAATGVDRSAFEQLVADAEVQTAGAFARLSQATGTKVIHIAERDTQVSSRPKAVNEFVNTWSIEGFYEEGTAPAELGWGTHERRLPSNAHVPIGGPAIRSSWRSRAFARSCIHGCHMADRLSAWWCATPNRSPSATI